jgi:hypothetical protein
MPGSPASERNAVAQHPEAVLGADHESVEAVEIIEAHFECIAEGQSLAHAPGEVAGGDLGVVLGLEVEPFALQDAAEIIMV